MLSQAAIPGIILAAGSSRRMGENKLLLMFRGKPILQHVIDAAQRSSLSPLILVLGADSDDLRSQINPGSLLIVNNPDFACGYGSSLQAELKALKPSFAGAKVVLKKALSCPPLQIGRRDKAPRNPAGK